MTGFAFAYAVVHGLWRSATEKSGCAYLLQKYKIFWNKSALQPKICKKETKNLEDKRKMPIFATSRRNS